MLFEGQLIFAPVDHPKRILDVGTGTGTWAVDVALYVSLLIFYHTLIVFAECIRTRVLLVSLNLGNQRVA